MVPKNNNKRKCFWLSFWTFGGKRQYLIYCFYGASWREQEVKRIIIGTTHRSLYKNANWTHKIKKMSRGQIKKLNRLIYIERIGSLFLLKFVHLLQCHLNMLQEGWIEISQRNKIIIIIKNYPKLLFSRTIKSHEELTEYSKPTKTGGTR